MNKILEISEREYRNLEACSYSTLAGIYRKGHKLHADQKESQALTFGSLVDCICLTPEDFEDNFYIVPKSPTASLEILARYLIKVDFLITNINSQQERLLEIMDELELWVKNTSKVRMNKITSNFIEYVNSKIENKHKLVISLEDLEKASKIKTTLDTHFITQHIFHPEDEYMDTLTQVKGTFSIDNIPMKFMCDIVVLDHEQKLIYIYDLKTGSSALNYFENSYIDYRYDIQHYIYTEGIKATKHLLQKDTEQYEVVPLQFIYIDKNYVEVPTIYKVDKEYDIYNGYKTKFGRELKGVKELLKEYVFYQKHGFELPKRWVENQGILSIDV
jgi:hypothetical protein